MPKLAVLADNANHETFFVLPDGYGEKGGIEHTCRHRLSPKLLAYGSAVGCTCGRYLHQYLTK
jgi:hypothetical protein